MVDFNWEDELDDAFFQQVDKIQELALTNTNTSGIPFTYPPPPPPPPPVSDVSYSPPRQLSQRFRPTATDEVVQSSNAQDQLEIQRLKSELSRVSKQLIDWKEECSELRRERDKKKQRNFVSSSAEAILRNPGPVVLDLPESGDTLRAEQTAGNVASTKEQKSVGIQTERADESVSTSTNEGSSSYYDVQKLRAIWCSESIHRSKRNFIAKFLETCASDLCFLFGLDPNMSSKIEKECLNFMTLPGNLHDLHPAEVARVSHLYSVLIKLSNDTAPLDALVEILLDLCSLGNALVVHRSLHMLHIALDHLFGMENSSEKRTLLRDNVKVKRCQPDAVPSHDSEVREGSGMHIIRENETSSLSHPDTLNNISTEECEMLCHVNWVFLFESVCQIAQSLSKEHARLEAVSIMTIILMRTHPHSERGKYVSSPIVRTVALLLRNEAGLLVQKEAVHIVYLLLNSPSILTTFCASCKSAEEHVKTANDGAKNLTFEECSNLLEGLASCIICRDSGEKELNLSRNAVMVLAFLASSGKLGLEIFLFHKLPKSANFLGLILHILVSEIDADGLDSCSSPEITKERTLLMREALILLNRLVSHPSYSSTVLRVLSSCRDMVSLAIDIATRLSKRSRRLLKCDDVTRQMRETEVVDLAGVFRKRVFTFIGEYNPS